MKLNLQLVAIICVALCLASFSTGFAQPSHSLTGDRNNAIQQSVTVAELDAKLSELENAVDMDAAKVALAKELLLQAKQHVQAGQKFAVQALQDQQRTTAAGQELQDTMRLLELRPLEPEPISASKELGELQLDLTQQTTELANIRKDLAQQSGEPSRRQARLLELPTLIGNAEKNAESVSGQLKQLAPNGEPAAVTDARANCLRTWQVALQQEIAAYEAERQFYTATTELLPRQRELLQRKAERLQIQVSQLTKAVEARRDIDIERLQRSTAEKIDSAPVPLQAAFRLNAELVEEHADTSKRLTDAISVTEQALLALGEIEAEFKTSKERVEAVGLNETLGLMFRRNKSWLASERRKYQPDGTIQAEISELQIELFRLQDLSKQASETDPSIARLFVELQIPSDRRAELHSAAENVLAQRREILTPLIQTQTELFSRLVALDTTQRKIVLEIDTYTQYINEHVLWIRSGATFGRGDIVSFNNALHWAFNPSHWLALPTVMKISIQKKFALFIFLIATIGILAASRRRMRLRIEQAGLAAETRACKSFVPTLVALINTLCIAAFWPLAIMAPGLMMVNVNNDSFAQALAMALISVGMTISPFELLRQTCRNHGLGQSHFGWANDSRKFLRSNLRWLTPVLTGLLLLVCLLQYQPQEEFRSSLGRSVMIILLLVPFIYVFKVMRPNSQLYRGVAASERNDHWYRFRVVRFVMANLIIAGLMLFTLGGYYYTTYQIGSRLLQTNALIVLIAITFGVAMRWLLVRRRKLKLEQLAKRRAEAERQGEGESALSENVKVDLQSDTGLDANEVSKQARELLLVMIGFVSISIAWQIWADIIPAVGILNRIELWSVTIDSVVEKVTLQHLLYSLLAIAGTVFAVKNLPGILELLLLNRLRLDAGARYAVATILRYLISVIGMIIAFTFLKIQWSQFSWLVAAISVGLGFGLQEIVANFVSGLILLLERPVRIGDVVTIEGTTGVVTRIQMRATTITNWDQQELVVPNKNLITNSIFNWTLSNVLTRITLEVGVAYGSDPEFVRNIILDVVNANTDVIKDPPASVTFQTFGDSSLNFVARCCISGPEKRLATIHNLQVAINNQLAKNKIAIPFPQRVVHTISAEPVKQDSSIPDTNHKLVPTN